MQATGKPAGVPREMRAMFPAVNPAKSDAAQPRRSPLGVLTGAVTSPLPEYDMIAWGSGPAGGGATRSSTDADSDSNVLNEKGCWVTVHPAAASRSMT